MPNDYRTNAHEVPVRPVPSQWRRQLSIVRDSFTRCGAAVLYITIVIGCGLLFNLFLSASNDQKQKDNAAINRHLAGWETALNQRQAIIDAKEAEEMQRERLRQLTQEELMRRAAGGK